MKRLIARLCFVFVFYAILATMSNAAERGISVSSTIPNAAENWGTYHALVIGINEYQYWPKLRTAVKDATVFQQVLIDKYGFKEENVTLRLDKDASRENMIRDIRRIASSMDKNDNLLIYFAGHGQLDDFTGDGYWIPAEGEMKETWTWVPNSMLKSILGSERLTAKNVLVIADSCYSGTMLRGGPSLLPLTDKGYKKKLMIASSKRSRQVISSGGVEPVADGGADGHSLFAYYLIKALQNNDREVIDLENLFHTRVWKPVTEIGDQRPNVGRLKTPMDDDGQFVLYNQAWADQQKRLHAQQAAARSKQQAEKSDQMAALQAERQRLELERQKLEMEKELMAQRQKLEMEKLKLEKEKQDLEYKKMVAAQSEKTKNATPAPAPLASVNQSQQPVRVKPSGQRTAAFFPMQIFAGSAYATHVMGNYDDDAVIGLAKALKRSRNIKLTHTYKEYTSLPTDAMIVDRLQDKTVERKIWKKQSMFATFASPNIKEIQTLGREIGVDAVIMFTASVDSPSRAEAFIVDVNSGKFIKKTSKTSIRSSYKATEQMFSYLFDQYAAVN